MSLGDKFRGNDNFEVPKQGQELLFEGTIYSITIAPGCQPRALVTLEGYAEYGF